MLVVSTSVSHTLHFISLSFFSTAIGKQQKITLTIKDIKSARLHTHLLLVTRIAESFGPCKMRHDIQLSTPKLCALRFGCVRTLNESVYSLFRLLHTPQIHI